MVIMPTGRRDAQAAPAIKVILMVTFTVQSSAWGSWDGRIANVHSPVGPGATRGSAASPSLPGRGVPPATDAAADVGV